MCWAFLQLCARGTWMKIASVIRAIRLALGPGTSETTMISMSPRFYWRMLCGVFRVGLPIVGMTMESSTACTRRS